MIIDETGTEIGNAGSKWDLSLNTSQVKTIDLMKTFAWVRTQTQHEHKDSNKTYICDICVIPHASS